MRSSLYFPGLLLLCFFACKKPTGYLNDHTWQDFKSPALSKVSLYDTLPKKTLATLDIHELHGVKASYSSGKYTCYFEYEADAEAILRAVSTLPFSKDEIADALCREMGITFSLAGQSVLSDEEIEAATFFWRIDPNEFTFYECLKGNQRHTILINNASKKILHRIEA